MLETLLGNKSAEKVMIALHLSGELHASAIAKIYNTALDPIKKQLARFEEAGFLTSREVGRSRLYSFNNKHPMYAPLLNMIQIALENNNKNKIKSKSQKDFLPTREI